MRVRICGPGEKRLWCGGLWPACELAAAGDTDNQWSAPLLVPLLLTWPMLPEDSARALPLECSRRAGVSGAVATLLGVLEFIVCRGARSSALRAVAGRAPPPCMCGQGALQSAGLRALRRNALVLLQTGIERRADMQSRAPGGALSAVEPGSHLMHARAAASLLGAGAGSGWRAACHLAARARRLHVCSTSTRAAAVGERMTDRGTGSRVRGLRRGYTLTGWKRFHARVFESHTSSPSPAAPATNGSIPFSAHFRNSALLGEQALAALVGERERHFFGELDRARAGGDLWRAAAACC